MQEPASIPHDYLSISCPPSSASHLHTGQQLPCSVQKVSSHGSYNSVHIILVWLKISHLNGGPTFWGEVQFVGVGLSQMGTLQGHQASLAAEVTIEEASLVVQGLSDSVVKNPPARQETRV